ncbi:hypothetical protein Q7P37_006182 [Cladosporium fusiforme]
MGLLARNPDLDYIHPETEVYTGLWCLHAGATAFLAARLWTKLTRRHGLWWDDYILIITWLVLTINDILITIEFATGYVTPIWDTRMHILIDTTSCLTLLGQSLSKTAFAVTLLKLTRGVLWQQAFLWFCIVTMNAYNVVKMIFEWGEVCGSQADRFPYRLDFCLPKGPLDDFKKGGNAYNIMMDFTFAIFPWLIMWKLDMKKSEKWGLCVVMSLGMVVAIESAIRTHWKYQGNPKDEMYFWRLGMSAIWYSSEVAGTIIVQCVPVLRALVKDVRTTITSRRRASVERLGSTEEFELVFPDPQWYHAK